MSTENNCQPCAPVPTVPTAPPPSCPATPACDEFVQSGCVVSDTEGNCTSVYIDPLAIVDTFPIPVGLVINEGTTLTEVYNQLTSTACIFNPQVIGAVLQTIGDPTHPNFNTTLNQIFCQIVCACACDDDCANVIAVEIATYTSVDIDSFDINFIAQPNYNYEITINDSNAVPFTFYTWNSITPPNITLVPTFFTINTDAFTKNVGNAITSPPPPTTLIAGHSHEVYINAIDPTGAACPAGPWTVVLPIDPSCTGDCGLVNIIVTGDPGNVLNFAIVVQYQSGIVYPQVYKVDIYDSNGQTVIPTSYYPLIAPTPVGGIYPTTSETFNFSSIISGDTYTVEVTPICSLVPLCPGDMSTATISFAGPLTCAPPDITNITVTTI